MRHPLILAIFVALLTLGGTTASGQTPVYGAGSDAESRPIAGWTLVPSLGYSGTWDDNALVRAVGDTLPGDYTSTLNPRALLEYTSHRTEFSGIYDGAFVAYRDLNTLNSFEQRANLSVKRLIRPHFAWFVRGSASSSPTTDVLGLVAVPFVRLGSRLVDARSGVEWSFTKRTEIIASYNVQFVDFDRDPLLGIELLGGHSAGASAALRHQVSQRITLTANYDVQRATVLDGSRFGVENGDAGIEFKAAPSLRLFGAFGVSRLDVDGFASSRTGPSWRMGVARRFGTSALDVSYSRSFVPSYSFGGTSENEELMSSLLMPFGRRFYTRSAFSWRRNEPLTTDGLRLRSIWIDGTVGYTLRPWMQIEGFYGGTRQNIERPGGRLDRNRAGFQIITARRMRVR